MDNKTATKPSGKYPALKMAEPLQVAIALYSGSDVFLTNDNQLKQLSKVTVVVFADCCEWA